MKKSFGNVVPFIVFLITGLLVFVVFSHIKPMLPGALDWIGRICLIATLLALSLYFKKRTRFVRYWPVFYGFFIALLAISVDYYLPSSKWLLQALKLSIHSPAGIALDKVDSSLIIITSILLFTKLSGDNLGTIFLKRGDLKQGIRIGIIAFMISVAGSVFVAKLFGAQNLTLARILPWLPWILLFILGNALNEELLFRGLFLKKINVLLGKLWSNIVLIMPFVLHHTGVTYTNDALMFLVYLIPLAFAWGYITQKTDSIWGSVLFHAGTDIPVILVILSNLS